MANGRLSSKLTLSISLALLPGVLFAIVYVSLELSQSPKDWTAKTRDQMISAELLNLDRLAGEKAAFAGLFVAQRPARFCYHGSMLFKFLQILSFGGSAGRLTSCAALFSVAAATKYQGR